MATNLNVTSGYNGSSAGDIFVQAFKMSDSIEKGVITVLPNVIGRGYLPRLTYSSDLQAYACGWNPTGDVDYADKEVVTKKFMIQHELCKDEFHQTFQAQSQGLFGANNEIPTDIQDAILLAIVKNIGAKVDYQIWNGNNSANQVNGILPQLVADVATVGITYSTITKLNVFATLDSVYALIPDEILEDEDLVMIVAKNVGKSYKQALASQGLNTYNGDKELDYLGIRLETIGGLPKNAILVYRKKNIGFLTGLEADFNQVLINDDQMKGTIETKSVFSFGVGYSNAGEIVYGRSA